MCSNSNVTRLHGCRSRKELQRLFSGIIQQRRKSGVKEDDVLQVCVTIYPRIILSLKYIRKGVMK